MSELPTASPRPAGSLTSVMRAIAPESTSAPKVLRVGLVRRGKVLDERVLRAEEHLTIGSSERATFVVLAPSLPPTFQLFTRVGDRYRLHVLPRMSGRIADGSRTIDLADPRVSAASDGSARVIDLGPAARGKVIVDDVAILFQHMVPAPSPGKAQLPSSVKSSVTDVDWRTSVIAAFSFLVHFGAVGSIYSDWMDPVVDDEVSTAQILESVKQLPAPPQIERPSTDAATNSPVASAAPVTRADAPSRVGGSGPTGGSAGWKGRGTGGGLSEGQAQAIASQMKALDLAVLMGLGGAGPSTASVLEGSDVPMGILDKAAASSRGARPGDPGVLDLGLHGSGPLEPGKIARSPLPGGDGTRMDPVAPGPAPSVRPPSGSVAVPGPTVAGGDVPNAAGTVAAMTPTFRRCYTNGLNREDPTMRGTIRVTAKIGPNGEVLSASASPSGNLSATVVGCVRGRVASAQFSAPTGGGATLIIPVTLIPQ